jgi:uncharacterized membrane protein
MPDMRWLLVIHLVMTCYMTGLIWFVQVVHYPLLAKVGHDSFKEYERSHVRLTTWVVGPVMLMEAGAAAWIAVKLASPAALAGFALLLVVWITTAVASVPCHHRLESGFDAKTHRLLTATNWIRTAGWTARAALAAILLESA